MIRLYEQTFTVPAGTSVAAPVTLPLTLEDQNLDTVRIIIPDGHDGLTGLRITWAGTQILPFNPGTWIVANGEIIDWPFNDEITVNGLSLAGYNTDVFAHSFYLRFQVSDRTASIVSAVSSGQLAPAITAAVSLDVGSLSAPPAPGPATAPAVPAVGAPPPFTGPPILQAAAGPL